MRVGSANGEAVYLRRARRTFHAVRVNGRSLRSGFIIVCLLLACTVLAGMGVQGAGFVNTDLIAIGFGRILPAFGYAEGSAGLIGPDLSDPYQVLCRSMPAISANAGLSEKYGALQQNGVVVKRNKAPAQSAEPEAYVLDNGQTVMEMDMGDGGDDIALRNETDYAIDVEGLRSKPLTFDMQSGGPKVLIVHTHTSEAYMPTAQYNYTPTDTGRTEDNRFNVVRVGEEIAKELEAAGISVVHDTSLNDYPSYNGSYTKTMGVIEDNLAKYPSIEIVLDVHRDYTEREDGTLLKPVTTIDGQKTAQVMFVVGTDAMDLYHPNWRDNLSFAFHINDKLNALYPNLVRCVNIRTERFNQHATKGSMILEMGSNSNTLEEAIRLGQYVGKGIAAVLNEQ